MTEPLVSTSGICPASELAPLAVTVGIVGAAWWLHAARPHWWAVILGITAVAAWVLAVFGARFGLAALIERLYAAAAAFAAGAWIAAATALGPLTSPAPASPGHRRRRARVRVERKLQAWPDIARAIGLAGAEVMSATVDVWGWRARFRLARGPMALR